MSVSVISACMNRVDPLSISIQSWAMNDQIDEIVFVDWSSDKSSEHLTEISPKIKRVYVPDQKYFNQPQPLNLAFKISSGDQILKLDSDTILNPYFNFFDEFKVDEFSFASGLYSPGHKCLRPIWGTIFVNRENYEKVGGYNEAMGEFVAWEDDEIVNRFLLSGLEHRRIQASKNTIFAMPHDNKKRIENFKAYNENKEIEKKVRTLMEKKGYDVEDNIDYAILSHHTILNNKKYKRYKGDSYYAEPVVDWNVTQVDEQNYVCQKIIH